MAASGAAAGPLAVWVLGEVVGGEAHEEYIRVLRAMTPEQKLRAASNLYCGARDLKAAWFRSQHPEWSEEQIQKAVRDAFLYARD